MLSLDFIAGLIAGEGSFMWIKQNNQEVPVFQLKMHASDKELVEMVRDGLNLNETIHIYNHQNRHYVLLLVRKRKTINEKIIPLLDGRLFGMKKNQFND
ncbi:MAG: LAGLIDADG family homing endonuclease [Patescibacteria group bacterium]